jgi:hypothetical protein
MVDSYEREDKKGDLSRLVSALKSNMGNLAAMRNIPNFLPEHGHSLEIAIDAQADLLNNETGQKSAKEGMGDFVLGKCTIAGAHQNRFIDNWFETKGKPCLKCDVDVSKCEFHKVLTRE